MGDLSRVGPEGTVFFRDTLAFFGAATGSPSSFDFRFVFDVVFDDGEGSSGGAPAAREATCAIWSSAGAWDILRRRFDAVVKPRISGSDAAIDPPAVTVASRPLVNWDGEGKGEEDRIHDRWREDFVMMQVCGEDGSMIAVSAEAMVALPTRRPAQREGLSAGLMLHNSVARQIAAPRGLKIDATLRMGGRDEGQEGSRSFVDDVDGPSRGPGLDWD